MRKIALFLIIGMFIPVSLVYGSFTVYYDKDTFNVMFAGNPDNIILSDADALQFDSVVKSGELKDYNLTEDLYDYQIINENFVINSTKISDRENKKLDDKDKKDKQDADILTAKDKLEALGLSKAEVDSLHP